MTVAEALRKGVETLRAAGIEEAEIDAAILLQAMTGIERAHALAFPEEVLPEEKRPGYEEALKRRADREPAAYITGEREFMGLPFHVRRGVLIPRDDTETLVEEVMLHLQDGMRILDLCTGSGCIALSLLHYSNDTTALGTDLSPEAVSCAEENAGSLGLKERYRAVRTDLFPEERGERYDLIVSNPPYIMADVIDTLMPEVRDHEPRMALDGGADGLTYYRRIIGGAPEWLRSDGWLFTEIGYDQGEAVADLFENAGFHETAVIKDLGGRDRVVKGCYYHV